MEKGYGTYFSHIAVPSYNNSYNIIRSTMPAVPITVRKFRTITQVANLINGRGSVLFLYAYRTE